MPYLPLEVGPLKSSQGPGLRLHDRSPVDPTLYSKMLQRVATVT